MTKQKLYNDIRDKYNEMFNAHLFTPHEKCEMECTSIPDRDRNCSRCAMKSCYSFDERNPSINAQMVLRMLGDYSITRDSKTDKLYIVTEEDKPGKWISLKLSLPSIEHESEETLTALHKILCENQVKE